MKNEIFTTGLNFLIHKLYSLIKLVTIGKIFRFGHPEHIFSFFTGYIRYSTSGSYFDTFYLIE